MGGAAALPSHVGTSGSILQVLEVPLLLVAHRHAGLHSGIRDHALAHSLTTTSVLLAHALEPELAAQSHEGSREYLI